MRRVTIGVLLVAFAGIPLAYNACSNNQFHTLNETETTNPYPVSDELLFATCSVINRCNPQVTFEACQNSLLSTGGFNVPLGLPANYSTFLSIGQAEQSGAITGNLAAAASCSDSVNALTCSDPTVIAAYNPSQTNPFAASPGMLSASSCAKSFSPGLNLEVPIELVDNGLLSNTTSTTFFRTRTSLNTTDYDGTDTYIFEVVANNSDSTTHNVSLVNTSGATVATIAIPNVGGTGQDDVQRYQVTFTPTAGANDYRIMLDATTSSGQLMVTTGRIRVQQVSATMTKIYVPLVQGTTILGTTDETDLQAFVDDTWMSTYSQQSIDDYSLWKKNNSAFSQLGSTTPWTFEAVLSANSGNTVYASLFDASTGLQVSSSEVSTASTTPTLVSQSFSDGAANFNNLDNMQVQLKTTGPTGYIYHAGLWIKLTNLSHAEVYYRNLTGNQLSTNGTSADYPFNRVLINPALFNSPSVYFQEVGSVSTAGTCVVSAFDNRTNDSGLSGSIVSGSSLNLTSTSITLQRSAALNINSGDRYTVSMGPNSSSSCLSLSSLLVIGF